jgi:DNA-binding IclR family transcriptional regulator
MMRKGVPQIQATARTLAMLEAIVADGGRSSVSALARTIGIPVATAHRQVATLLAQAYVATNPRGGYVAGPRLVGLLHRLDAKEIIANASAPFLDDVARELGTVVQLGTFENDMVTYRIKAGPGSASLFTKVGMQLEAYCSGMGKVLLAHLPETERDAYLAAGPFPALTERTITDPSELRAELRTVHEIGHAIDNEEIAAGLTCVAVPVRTSDGNVVAAISASFAAPLRENLLHAAVGALTMAASRVKRSVGLPDCHDAGGRRGDDVEAGA